VFKSQINRNFWLALVAAAVLAAAGCSQSATDQANNGAKPAATAKSTAPAKPASTAKPTAKPAAKPTPAATAKTTPAVKPVAAKAPVVAKTTAEPAEMMTVPKGTAISATVSQTLATDKNKAGDTFSARLATPIELDGKTVIPKGAKVTGRIVTVKRHELKVTLASVVIHGKSYPLDTNAIIGPKTHAKSDANGGDDAKVNKDVTLLAAKSQLKFKLAKPVTIPVKG
jgi:glucose/arabinose dehydrogenase